MAIIGSTAFRRARGGEGYLRLKLGRSGRGAGAYLFVAGAQRLVTLVLLPLFALVLTVTELGHVAVLVSLAGLTSVIVSLGLEAPLLRTAVTQPGGPGVSAIGRLLVLLPVGASLLVGAALVPLAGTLDLEPEWLLLSVLGAGLTISGSLLPMTTMRAGEEFAAYSRYALVLTALTTTIRVVAVFGLGWGVLGWVVADVMNGVFACVLGARRQVAALRVRPDTVELRKALGIGVPLVPHFLAHWSLGLSDRVILTIFLAPGVVGVYGVAYQLGAVATLAVTEISRSLHPRFGEAVTSAQARLRLPSYARALFVISVAAAATVTAGGVQVLYVLFPSDFAAGAEFIPWVSLAAVFLGLYFIPMGMMTLVAGDTRRVWLATVAAAAVNIALNVWLVPVLGAVAAAINTAVGYAVMWLLVEAFARSKATSLRWEPRKCALPATAIVIVALATLPLVMLESWVGLLAAGASVVVVWVVAAKWLTVERRHVLAVRVAT